MPGANQPGAADTGPGTLEREYQIQLEPPSAERVFRLEPESALYERIRQEFRQRMGPERAEFPAEVVLAEPGTAPAARRLPPSGATLVPSYVCYKPLWFEVKNNERYGWELGVLQPFVSQAAFYADLALLPYNAGALPQTMCESNVGYALPGDAIPFYLYTPPFSWRGVATQTATMVGGNAVFP
jgi:hypothetical protein